MNEEIKPVMADEVKPFVEAFEAEEVPVNEIELEEDAVEEDEVAEEAESTDDEESTEETESFEGVADVEEIAEPSGDEIRHG